MRWKDKILELHRLRQETDCHAQNYEASHASEGTHSEPVHNWYITIEATEKCVASLGQKVIPVMRLRNFLKITQSERYRTMYYVMELYYFERWKLGAVSEHLQKSVKTIARRRHELVDLTIDELERGVFDYELEHSNGSDPDDRSGGVMCGDMHTCTSAYDTVSVARDLRSGV